MAAIDAILKMLTDRRGSDLHLKAGFKPLIREQGHIATLDGCETLTPDMCQALIEEIMPARNRSQFDEDWDTDFAYATPELGRFRVNALRDRCGWGAVMRTIPTEPPNADDLHLPQIVRDFCYLPKGLVVVTGATGSGKSTTLAAMIDLINRTRADHVITIEDPIEFTHTPKKCLVTQREVHQHTRSFAAALRAALREDPDVVLVGEMRDLETMEIAIEMAETGHLVFGTLHTNTAASTVERMIDKFPSARQNQIRSMLADSLKGVISQTLCRRRDGKGRVAAMEILVVTRAVANNIREGKTYQIGSSMQTGRAQGMQLFEDALLELLKQESIAPEEAYLRAIDKDELVKKMAAMGIRFDLGKRAGVAMAPKPAALKPVALRPKAAAAAKTAPAPAPSGGTAEAPSQENLLNRFMEALAHNPDDPEVLNNLAWVLATLSNPDPSTADRALEMAEKASLLTDGRHPGVLDTLGAAYAQGGQFDKALEVAQQALALAREVGQDDLATALESRIALYQAKRPARE